MKPTTVAGCLVSLNWRRLRHRRCRSPSRVFGRSFTVQHPWRWGDFRLFPTATGLSSNADVRQTAPELFWESPGQRGFWLGRFNAARASAVEQAGSDQGTARAGHAAVSPRTGWMPRSRRAAHIRWPLPAGPAAARRFSQPRRCTERASRVRGTARWLDAAGAGHEPPYRDNVVYRLVAEKDRW